MAVAQRWLARMKRPALDLSCQLGWKHWDSRLGHWQELSLRPTANSLFAPAEYLEADFGSPVTRSLLADCQQSAGHLSLALTEAAMCWTHRWEHRSPAWRSFDAGTD